jgi:hypothetical protein
MRKLLLPLMAIFLLVGCEKIEGQLNISKDVKLFNSDRAARVLRVGTYSADIKANTSKKITLRLNNDSDEKYIFNLPEGSKIPANGNFSFKPKEIGQPVNLSGSVATIVSNSDRIQSWKSCTYTEYYSVCTPGPGGSPICSTYPRIIQGQKLVTYFDRRTDKDVNLSIAAEGSLDEVAQFQGDISWIDRIIVRETSCR